jgi:hypothetical protein
MNLPALSVVVILMRKSRRPFRNACFIVYFFSFGKISRTAFTNLVRGIIT